MILNLPNKNNFYETANHLLNSAWENVILIISESPNYILKTQEVYNFYKSEDHQHLPAVVAEKNRQERIKKSAQSFWFDAKHNLSPSIAMLTQAVEFYIKGNISDISPYLLISSSPKDWPGKSDKETVDFSDFKTVDAQDLLKIHDTMCSEKKRLGDDFKSWFSCLRKKRNKIMHTVSMDDFYDPVDILIQILQCHEFFFGKHGWIDARMSHIENNVTTGFIHLDTEKERYNYIIEEIHNDLVVLFHHIKPQQTLRFFNFCKKERACLCPVCILSVQEIYSDCKQTEHFLKTLQQAPENNHLSCFVCGHKAKYIGVCNDDVDGNPERDKCFGETVDLQSGECLWCSRNQ